MKIILLLIAILIVYFSPVLFTNSAGFYEPLTGFIYCKTESICLHEQAHKYDHDNGYISRTPEYQTAVTAYINSVGVWVLIFMQTRTNKNWFNKIYLKYVWYEEVYATIAQIKIPETLKEYYQ